MQRSNIAGWSLLPCTGDGDGEEDEAENYRKYKFLFMKPVLKCICGADGDVAAELGGGDYGRLAGGAGEGILRCARCERTVIKIAAGDVWDPLTLKFFVFG